MNNYWNKIGIFVKIMINNVKEKIDRRSRHLNS